MRKFLASVVILALSILPAAFSSPVTLTISGPPGSAVIPADFSGLSFETALLLPDANGQHIFSRTNKPLLALFRTLGVHSLRLGGNTADLPKFAIPSRSDIDDLFAFAKAARVKVIYTLRLRGGDISADTDLARYIARHYQKQLTCFAIGNEPDYYKKVFPAIKDYPAYREAWKKYATAIAQDVPGSLFCAPCTGGNPVWSRDFANDFATSGLVALITQHDYPGGTSRRATNAAIARDQMLSPAWLDHYEEFYNGFAANSLSNGLAYRLEEASNFSDGGVKDASDTFAAALWSLDYLHWWAAHGASGINLHGRRWVPNCVIHPVSDGNYNVRPIGYGIMAFNLGAHGRVQPLSIANPENLNLTAYAVRDGGNVYVTVINKDHGPDAHAADVTIVGNGISKNASIIFLTAPDGGVAAKVGVTLGGAPLQDNGSWSGKWGRLKSAEPGQCVVTVPSACAAIAKLSIKQD
jgi:hypothetical protein